MKVTKEQIYGWIGSVIINILILLLLIFTVLQTVVPDESEGGVLVNFGTIDEASGMFEPEGDGRSAYLPPQSSSEVPAEEDLVIQTHEESVVIPDAPRRNNTRRVEQTQRQSQTLQRQNQTQNQTNNAQEQQRQTIANQVANAFGTASSSPATSQGAATTSRGNQGSPQGNSDMGANSGTGYGSVSLSGRNIGPEGLPRPAYSVQEGGVIVVNITVNPNGDVIYAGIGRGTNIDNETMRKSALEAARKAKFNPIEGTNNQSGTITYRYELK